MSVVKVATFVPKPEMLDGVRGLTGLETYRARTEG